MGQLNSFRVNRESRLLFPTPESPINTTVEGKSRREGREEKMRQASLYTVRVMGEVGVGLYVLIDPINVDIA